MVQYHFRLKDGPSIGPVGDEEFQLRKEAGDIGDETMVWRSGMLDWTTYGKLRALDEQKAQDKRGVPPPLPASRESVAPVARPAVTFSTCGYCKLEWPDNLLFEFENKPICGNCQRKMKDDNRYKPVKKRSKSSDVRLSSGWGAWFLKCVLLAVVLGGLLFLKAYFKRQRSEAGKILKKQEQMLIQHGR